MMSQNDVIFTEILGYAPSYISYKVYIRVYFILRKVTDVVL